MPALAEAFLVDLANANRSPHTRRGYRSELARLAASHPGPAATITTETLRVFLSSRARLAPTTRARTEAAISSFLAWAYRHGYIDANPMARLDRLHLKAPPPRGRPRAEIDAVLGAIPATNYGIPLSPTPPRTAPTFPCYSPAPATPRSAPWSATPAPDQKLSLGPWPKPTLLGGDGNG